MARFVAHVALFLSPKKSDWCFAFKFRSFIAHSKRKTSPVMTLQYANSTFYFTNSVSHPAPPCAKNAYGHI